MCSSMEILNLRYDQSHDVCEPWNVFIHVAMACYGCHWLKGLRTDMIREASQGDETHPLETVGTPMVDSDAPVSESCDT